MPAYFIVQSTIKDEAQFQKYRQAVVPFIANSAEGLTPEEQRWRCWKVNMTQARS